VKQRNTLLLKAIINELTHMTDALMCRLRWHRHLMCLTVFYPPLVCSWRICTWLAACLYKPIKRSSI